MKCFNDITLNIIQGDTYESQELLCQDDAGDPVDVSSGYTAALMARTDIDSDTTVLSLTDTDGLTLAATGITVSRTAVESAALDFTKLVFDLKVTKTADSTVYTVARGKVLLTKAVTRSA